MKRLAWITALLGAAVLAGAVYVLAAGNGTLHAESVNYVIGETESTLTLEEGVTFSYNGYTFSSESVELILEKPEPEALVTELKRASFSTEVNVTTPSGGSLFTDSLNLQRSGARYIFTGGMSYREGRLSMKASRIEMDSTGSDIFASGGVKATYRSTGGFRGADGADHEVLFTGDTLHYDRASGTLNSDDGGAHIVYDGFMIDAGSLTLEIESDRQLGFAALDSVSIHGRGIVVNGLNASYDPSSGELRIWDQVVYKRSGDEFKADEVTWFVREDNDRISVKGGEATIDLEGDVETNGEPVDNGSGNG